MHEVPSFVRLERALEKAGMGWTLCFIGDGQTQKLVELNDDLQLGFDAKGSGKKVVSGFAYWGTGPTVAWKRACDDPLYRVMRDGIKTFPSRWKKLCDDTKDLRPLHYVSLGVGTGEKDTAILQTLLDLNSSAFYFPVDMSPEMIRLGVEEAEQTLPGRLKRSRLLPVQIDFSDPTNVRQFRQLLDDVTNEEPTLFSLLGNTLANFDHDSLILQTLSELVREKDELLLEVAWTDALSEEAGELAIAEYKNSEQFRRFVRSALIQNTNIQVDGKNVVLEARVEPERAIRVTVYYRNATDAAFSLVGVDRQVDFRKDDTIRLLVTRKYDDHGIKSLLAEGGLVEVGRHLHVGPQKRVGEPRFGLCLVLCRFAPQAVYQRAQLPTASSQGRASDSKSVVERELPQRRLVFVSYCHKDRVWLEQLHVHLQAAFRDTTIDLWDDGRISAGDVWRDEITRALDGASAAILLVTPDFLASKFVGEDELPPLLKGAEERGVKIFWIPVKASGYRRTKIEKYQAAHPPDKPLNGLTAPKRDEAFVRLCEKIRAAVLSQGAGSTT